MMDWLVHSVLDWTTYERFNRAAPVGGNGDHASSKYVHHPSSKYVHHPSIV